MIEQIKENFNKKKVGNFLAIGGICAILYLTIVYCLTSGLGVNYLASTILAIIFVNFVSFYLNKKLTFKTRNKLFWRELWKFYSVMASSHFLNIMGVFILVDIIKLNYLLANIFCTATLTPVNYIFHHRWSFNKKKKKKPRSPMR
ncbi:GtrA family protein [Cyanobacterium stanieri LEGE 03274]|uniref:GtrA family protein n=1 Tax=Cyanobacterium stanieri LEGE 03274 TaxID=1828756 RepID=A0ABR9V5E3_9CHRO|nr:GtrA family protein [Cyanobacterium stanieri]MBE9223115.1 GtrA family protein [Cyanobacterium stanieri LEGE 03274]